MVAHELEMSAFGGESGSGRGGFAKAGRGPLFTKVVLGALVMIIVGLVVAIAVIVPKLNNDHDKTKETVVTVPTPGGISFSSPHASPVAFNFQAPDLTPTGTMVLETCPNTFFDNKRTVCSTKWRSWPNACSLGVSNLDQSNTSWIRNREVGVVAWPGTCECPNDCYAEMGKGVCGQTQCECAPGWRGPDCSLPDCSSATYNNPCSGRGQCMKGSNGQADYCQCNPGYMLMDCSGVMANPEEITFPIMSQTPYWRAGGDKYGGDDNALYNRSTIAEWHISMTKEDYAMLLESPLNTSYPGEVIDRPSFDCTVTMFKNGVVNQTPGKAKIKVRGNSTPFLAQKPLGLKLENDLFGQKNIKMLPEARDPSYIRDFRAAETFRAIGVPYSRHSFSVVYINEVYHGIYWMYEGFNGPFFKARWGTHSDDDGSALYKCPNNRQGLEGVVAPNCSQYYWESNCIVEFGEGAPLCEMLETAMCKSGTCATPPTIDALDTKLQVDEYIRAIAGEAVLGNWDNSNGGGGPFANNFFWYYGPPQGHDHGPVSDSDRRVNLLIHDYEFSQGAMINWWQGTLDCPTVTMDVPRTVPNSPAASTLPAGLRAKWASGAGAANADLYLLDKSQLANATITPYPAWELKPHNGFAHQTFLNWVGVMQRLYAGNTSHAVRVSEAAMDMITPAAMMDKWHFGNTSVFPHSKRGFFSLPLFGTQVFNCYAPPSLWAVGRGASLAQQIQDDAFGLNYGL